jgi:hypothetical protein
MEIKKCLDNEKIKCKARETMLDRLITFISHDDNLDYENNNRNFTLYTVIYATFGRLLPHKNP